MTLLDDARAMADDLADLRHRLHRRPEIGLRLQQTQATVLQALRRSSEQRSPIELPAPRQLPAT